MQENMKLLKRLKKLMLLRLLILTLQLKKLTIKEKLLELKRNYLIINMINLLLLSPTENVVARLEQSKLATKSDIVNIVKKVSFDE